MHTHTHTLTTHTHTHTHRYTLAKLSSRATALKALERVPIKNVCAYVCQAQLALSERNVWWHVPSIIRRNVWWHVPGPGSYTQLVCVCVCARACVRALAVEREQQPMKKSHSASNIMSRNEECVTDRRSTSFICTCVLVCVVCVCVSLSLSLSLSFSFACVCAWAGERVWGRGMREGG